MIDWDDTYVPDGLPPPSSGSPRADRFRHKICLVTGAASGIGRATVLRFAAEGATVVAADRDSDGTRETLAMAGQSDTGLPIEIDVRSAASVASLPQQIDDRLGRLDVLVNNAGIEILGDIMETEPDVWDEVMAVNLRGTYLVSRAVLPLLLRQAQTSGGTAIVHNASLMGLVSSRRLAAYCASKAGVVSLTRSMALDCADKGVRVNCVCPGIIHTPMLERRFALVTDRVEAYRRAKQRPPVKYLGQPEDVAGAIAYLASDEARFITGSILTVDGGVGAE